MSKGTKRYPAEFRRRMVELVRSGRSFADLSKEFEVSSFSIRYWVKKADQIENPTSPASIAMNEADELKALRKENRILREEREILKKAAAWFAQESGTPSSRRSSL
jgi:transposase